MHNESIGHGYKEFWAKLRAEPELLRARQEESRRLNRRLIETSATARAKKVATAMAYFHAHRHDETYIRYKAISRWFFCLPDRSKSAWARQNLPWKTHIPIEHPEKIYHFYSCCGTDRFLKSGWQSKTDPSEFLCNTHYAARGWNTAMPEGYEDARSFSEIRARYKELNP
ncbi:hypothetical protein E4T44_03885 [Aureobasidium sp. EXF-8845]|nr:hypothetical protein E4T44_03885 [Aureobasidium sp. EXF-8845]KAI4855233.1 hypothetical protein E4T45_03331 [Aureobasidium sp. EXF-8846]